jgi:hypothetical protein
VHLVGFPRQQGENPKHFVVSRFYVVEIPWKPKRQQPLFNSALGHLQPEFGGLGFLVLKLALSGAPEAEGFTACVGG